MTYALDYNEMLNTICYGLYQPNQGTYHPTSWMFPKEGPQPIEQDLAKARQLLDEAGWIDTDNDGIRDKMFGSRSQPFEFTIHCGQTETAKKVSTLLKESLDQIGVVCHVKPTEFAVLQQINLDHKFQATLGGWGTGTDPDTSSNIFKTDEPRNYGVYSNKRVDELFKQGKHEFDPEKRAAIYAEIHTILWDDQPYTWLYYRNAFYAFNKKLRGYNFSPRGPYNYGPGFSSLFVPLDANP